jgi:membrane-associated protease RseP (regulator of RpoE activity)
VLDLAETLVGEVTSTRGERLADADVAVTTDMGVTHARTDKEGAFVLSDLVIGSARLLVQVPGYAPSKEEINIEPSSSHRITLPRIELAEEGVVEGSVVDGRGDPVPGARVAKDRVATYLAQGPTPRGIAIADARGRFRLGGLPAGALRLEAYAPDVGRGTVEGIVVVAGRPTLGVQIHLARDRDESLQEPASSGGVAVTLGETAQDPREVVLVDVAQGSEAERSGLVVGDVLLSVDGAPVHSMAEARSRLAGPLGDDVLVEFRRGEGIDSVRVGREPVRK